VIGNGRNIFRNDRGVQKGEDFKEGALSAGRRGIAKPKDKKVNEAAWSSFEIRLEKEGLKRMPGKGPTRRGKR